MKTTQEMIAVMQAFADGKEIEYTLNGGKHWESEPHPDWSWNEVDYRIKPEPPKPKIVPYESAEEFLAAMKEHGPYVIDRSYKKDFYCIPMFSDDREYFIDFFNNLVWQDGTPCGKEVME